jgi:hypothetical protein
MKPGVGHPILVRGESEVLHPQHCVADRVRECEMQLAPLAGGGVPPCRGSEQGVRDTYPCPVEGEQAGPHGVLDREGVDDRGELEATEGRAERDCEQRPPHRLQEGRHTRAEDVVHEVRNRELGADLGGLLIAEEPAELERE